MKTLYIRNQKNSCRNHLSHCLAIAIFLLPLAAKSQVNYGAEDANKKFRPSGGLLGGRTNFDYLNLENNPTRSGVPLGGIGVGNVELGTNGRFVRIGLNNIHEPQRNSKACFFALWSSSGKKTKLTQLVKDTLHQFGMESVKHIYYTGLFPSAEMSFGSDGNVVAKIKAWSSLVPHDLKNSTLPVVFFECLLKAKKGGEVALAFSWEDFIGKAGLRDPKSVEGMTGQVFGREELLNAPDYWPLYPAVKTFAENVEIEGWSGVRQYSKEPLQPKKATMQNYVNEVAILAQQQSGVQVSTLPAYSLSNGNPVFKALAQSGDFLNSSRLPKELCGENETEKASVVCVKTSLKSGEEKKVRFMLVWYYPELKVDKENDAPGSFCSGCGDYGRYFHNYFSNLKSLVNYATQNHEELLDKTMEWQKPILNSTLPEWLKFKLINCGYVIFTNVVLNKKGDVTVNEGGMGGLSGTMDQRISSHPFYQKFFTKLDRSELDIFADAQAANGSINHFNGHYYVGIGTVGGRVPVEGSWMIDNTEGWIIQVIKDFQQTGEKRLIERNIDRIKDGMKFVKSRIPEGLQIPVGPTTYDDFHHPPVYCYNASMYLATLLGVASLAKDLGDEKWRQDCMEQFDKTQKDMIRLLWNGEFFSYGCETDGSKRRDSILFTGQLAGAFVSRYCGWGDILPMDYIKTSIKSQLKISVGKTPDYYANKVWDMKLGRGIDNEGSQCWPFYLESYTAYPAWFAGFESDALKIMKHIQLVHLRLGLTWCQNLWNPGDITYMTAPVTWFFTDMAANAGLNVNREELRLSPSVNSKEKVILPLYYPTFWATLTVDPAEKKITVKIEKVLSDKEIKISKIVIVPNGIPFDQKKEIEIPTFIIRKGAVLDVSSLWKHFETAVSQPKILGD